MDKKMSTEDHNIISDLLRKLEFCTTTSKPYPLKSEYGNEHSVTYTIIDKERARPMIEIAIKQSILRSSARNKPKGGMAKSIDWHHIGFSTRVKRVLRINHINTIEELAEATEDYLLSISTFGVTSLKEVVQNLAGLGLRLKGGSSKDSLYPLKKKRR